MMYSPEDRRSNSANIFLGNNCSSLLSRSNQSLPTSPTVLTEQMKSFTTPTEYSDSSNNSSYGTSSWNIVIQSSNCNKSMKSETNLLTSKNKQNPGSNETDHSCSPQISDQITAEEKNCFSRVLSSSQTIETFSSTKTSSFTQSPRSLTSSLSTISILPSSYDMNKKPAVCDVEKTEGIQRLHFPWSPSVSSFSHKLNKSFPENGGKFTSKLFKEWQNESTNTSSDDDDDNEEQCMDDTSLSLDSDEQLVHQTNALIREVSRCYSLSSINFTSSSSSSEEFASPKIVCIKKPVENEVYEFIHIPSNSLSSTKCLKYVGENAYMEEMENLMKSKSDYYPYSVCICARENKYGQKKFQSICETNQPSLWLLSYLYNNEYDIRYSDGKQPLPHYPNDQADNSDEIKYEFTYSSFPPVIVRCKKQEYRPSDSSLQKESDSLFNNTDTDNEISSQCLSPETTEISNRIFIGDKSVYEKLTVLDLEQYTASTAATTTTTTNKEIQKQLRTKLPNASLEAYLPGSSTSHLLMKTLLQTRHVLQFINLEPNVQEEEKHKFISNDSATREQHKQEEIKHKPKEYDAKPKHPDENNLEKELSKFCHECREEYASQTAKFCYNCGTYRFPTKPKLSFTGDDTFNRQWTQGNLIQSKCIIQ